jgi:hypothetical protein
VTVIIYTACTIQKKKTKPTITYYGTEMKSECVPSCAMESPKFSVTLVARLLVSAAAQALCRCDRGVFTGRTCVYSRTLLGIEIVCYCS